MKGFINIQNLVRYLNPVKKSPGKIRNVDKEFVKQLDFKDKNFLFMKKTLWK